MNVLPGTTRLTADSVLGISGKPFRLFSVHLVSGGTASTTSFKNGTGTSGTAYLQVDGTISKGVTVDLSKGMLFPDGCFMDTDANISYCTVVGTVEPY
jgi:hypothetical protein